MSKKTKKEKKNEGKSHYLNPVTHIPKWWNLAQLYFT